MGGEVKLKIFGKEYVWRDTILTSVAMVRLMKLKQPSDLFQRIRDEGPTEELVGGLVAAGIMYQPDEQGRNYHDIGITPLDAIAGMDRKDASLQDVVMMVVDAMTSVRPTPAGGLNPAAKVKGIVRTAEPEPEPEGTAEESQGQ